MEDQQWRLHEPRSAIQLKGMEMWWMRHHAVDDNELFDVFDGEMDGECVVYAPEYTPFDVNRLAWLLISVVRLSRDLIDVYIDPGTHPTLESIVLCVCRLVGIQVNALFHSKYIIPN